MCLCCVQFAKLSALLLSFQLPLRGAFSQEISPGDSGSHSIPVFPVEKCGKGCVGRGELSVHTGSCWVRALLCFGAQRDPAVPKPHSTSAHSLAKLPPMERDLLEIHTVPAGQVLLGFSLPGSVELHDIRRPCLKAPLPGCLSPPERSAHQRCQQAGAAGCCQTHTRPLNKNPGPGR